MIELQEDVSLPASFTLIFCEKPVCSLLATDTKVSSPGGARPIWSTANSVTRWRFSNGGSCRRCWIGAQAQFRTARRAQLLWAQLERLVCLPWKQALICADVLPPCYCHHPRLYVRHTFELHGYLIPGFPALVTPCF